MMSPKAYLSLILFLKKECRRDGRRNLSYDIFYSIFISCYRHRAKNEVKIMANSPIIFKGTSAKMLNSGGLEFKNGTQIDTYAGNPNSNVTATKGSLILDTTDNLLYQNSSGTDIWVRVDEQALYRNAGIVAAGTVTNNGDGTVTIGDTTTNFYGDASWSGNIYQEVVTGGTFTIVDDINSLSYVVVDYNAGSPTMRLTTTASEIDGATVFPVITASRNGTNVCVLDWNSTGAGTTEKLFQKDTITQRFYIDTPLVLDETGTNEVTVSSGSVWFGTKKITLDAVDSSADGTVTTFYHNSGSWTCSQGTTYNTTQYDDGTDLVTLTSNRYAVNWVFRTVDSSKKNVCIVLGQGDYTLSEALESNLPSIPEAVRGICVFIGRIIVQKGNSVADRIEQVQETSLNTAGVTSHSALSDRDAAGNHSIFTPLIDTTSAFSFRDSSGSEILAVDTVATEEKVRIDKPLRVTDETSIQHNLNLLGNYSLKQYDSTGTTQYSYIRSNSTSLNFSAVDVPMTFKVGGVGGTEAMRITGDGKIGVGTDTPTATLDVKVGSSVKDDIRFVTDDASAVGASATSNILQIQNNSINDSVLWFRDGSSNSNDWALWMDTSEDKLKVNYETNNVLAITGAGKIGVGTDTPAVTLDVNGNFWLGDGTASDLIWCAANDS